MITAWFSKWSTQVVVAAIILLAAAALAYGSVRTFQDIIREAVQTATDGRDSHWKAEIATANEAAAKNIIEQMKASQAANQAAQEKIARLEKENSRLENANAALSDTPGSGIDVDRTRLLNNQFLGGIAYPAN
ncbi:hypothetical protein EHE22_09545 [Ochrobactrum pseudogrignonense]|uniref:Uncharacterized protein n=1 Tax=Brucella pseudogrignonensis TaxID=419475 RepID=A0A7Y3WWY4_9HYPH|nr:hypothetical protein [Brucella pseudogrignonensis]NNV20669.1 hypothetical protein [Brucella pseudogrignonensis]